MNSRQFSGNYFEIRFMNPDFKLKNGIRTPFLVSESRFLRKYFDFKTKNGSRIGVEPRFGCCFWISVVKIPQSCEKPRFQLFKTLHRRPRRPRRRLRRRLRARIGPRIDLRRPQNRRLGFFEALEGFSSQNGVQNPKNSSRIWGSIRF